MIRLTPRLSIALGAGVLVSIACAVFVFRRGWGRVPGPSGPHAVRQEWSVVPTPTGDVRVHVSCPEPAAGRQRFPVLLFAPAWASAAPGSPLLLADLASHGYCVCAFDDIAKDPAPPGETAEDERVRKAGLDWSTHAKWQQLLAAGERRAAWQVAKARAVLDGLEALAAQPAQPYAAMDIDHIGFVGFSFGGAVAAETALHDQRIRACANLDGFLFGAASKRKLPRPFLMIVSPSEPADRTSGREATRVMWEWAQADEGLIARSLDGECVKRVELRARHEEFSDDLFSPGWKGRVRLAWSDRLALRTKIVRALLEFFDLHLKGSKSCA